MQNTFWKLLSLGVVICVGFLVVLQVQRGLNQQSQHLTGEFESQSDPDENTILTGDQLPAEPVARLLQSRPFEPADSAVADLPTVAEDGFRPVPAGGPSVAIGANNAFPTGRATPQPARIPDNSTPPFEAAPRANQTSVPGAEGIDFRRIIPDRVPEELKPVAGELADVVSAGVTATVADVNHKLTSQAERAGEKVSEAVEDLFAASTAPASSKPDPEQLPEKIAQFLNPGLSRSKPSPTSTALADATDSVPFNPFDSAEQPTEGQSPSPAGDGTKQSAMAESTHSFGPPSFEDGVSPFESVPQPAMSIEPPKAAPKQPAAVNPLTAVPGPAVTQNDPKDEARPLFESDAGKTASTAVELKLSPPSPVAEDGPQLTGPRLLPANTLTQASPLEVSVPDETFLPAPAETSTSDDGPLEQFRPKSAPSPAMRTPEGLVDLPGFDAIPIGAKVAARSQQESTTEVYELTGHPSEATTKIASKSASSEYFNPHGNPADVRLSKPRIRDISSAHLDSRVPGDNGAIAAVSAPPLTTPSISSETSTFDPQPNPFPEPTTDSQPQPAAKPSQPIEKAPVKEPSVDSDPFGLSPFNSPPQPTSTPVKSLEEDIEKQPAAGVPSPAPVSAPLEQDRPPMASPMAPTPAAPTFTADPAVGGPESNSGVTTLPKNSGGNASFRGDATVTESAPRGPQQPQLTIEKVAPPNAVLGQPMVYSIVIKNIGQSPASQVTVEDRIPKGSRLTGTIPRSEMIDRKLIWRLGTVEPGEEKTISVRVIPTEEGSIGSVATVNFVAEVAAETLITVPKLSLQVGSPKRARVGETILIDFALTNTGNGDATGVFLRNLIPQGLSHPGGNDLEYEVGTLAAGQTQKIQLSLTAVAPGSTVDRAIATADGGLEISRDVAIQVAGSDLALTRSAPDRQLVGRNFVGQNTVTNATDVSIRAAVITEVVPTGIDFVEASDNGVYDPAKRTITWTTPLGPRESKTLRSTLVPRLAGQKSSLVRGVDEHGVATEVRSEVEAVGFALLDVEAADLTGPVLIGDQVSLRMELANKGSAAATNVAVEIDTLGELKFKSARGLVKDGESEGRTQFVPVARIEPGETLTFDVVFQAVAAGDTRVRLAIASDQMSRPLNREEPIVVVQPDNQ